MGNPSPETLPGARAAGNFRRTGGVAVLLFVVALFGPVPDAPGEIYRWVDDRGVIHFGDALPDRREAGSPAERVPAGSVRPQFAPAEGIPGGREFEWPEPSRTVRRQRQSVPTVELYTSRGCGACVRAKHFLNSREIAFTEYDVGKDSEARRRWRETYGANGVPLAVINGTAIVGFSQARYEQALASSP